jgi:Skp family chaperone for outer membrane proteins
MFHRWLVLIVVGCAVFGAACQKDSGDAGASMEKQAEQAAGVVKDMAAETEEAAETLDADAKALYDKVAAELEGKKDELAAVKEKIAAMNPEDLMSDAGKALKENAEKLTGEIATLQKKLEGMAG